MSELLVPVLALALVLVAGAVIGVVALRRRRTSRRGRVSAPAPRRIPRLRADRGTDLARPEQLGIRTLTESERQRYLTAWAGVESREQRLPALALSEADAVLDRLLRDCGYPVDDPRAPADVVPGRHAQVLSCFRAGHALEQINSSSHSDAEQVRQGMAHFRTAFDIVVAEGTPAFPAAPRLLSAEHGRSPRPHPGR